MPSVFLLAQLLKPHLPPARLVRIAFLISGVWFLVVYPALNCFYSEKLPRFMRAGCNDFLQYYSGGLVARHGLWEELYPQPNVDLYQCEPEFKPLIGTPLFDPKASRKGQWTFYPQIAAPEASNVSPKLLALCPRLQGTFHYMYPPPLALLLWPLAFLDYPRAVDLVWFPLMSFSYFGIGYFASRIYRQLSGKVSGTEACILLLPLIPTFLSSNMSTTFGVGNVSPLLGFLISWTSYSWIRNRQLAIGIGMIPLVLFKGIGLTWCPLLLLKPVKWRAIGALTLLAVLINGITASLAGAGIYRTFFVDVLPKAHIPLGVGIQAVLKILFGINPKPLISAFNLLLLGAVFLGFWRKRCCLNPVECASTLIAAFAATMSIFCLCNPIVWPHHYFVNYLQLPFAGWILWEGQQARGCWKKMIHCIAALSFLFWIDGVMLMKDSYLVNWLKQSHLYSERMNLVRSALSGSVVFGLSLIESSFFLALAYRRLLFAPSATQELQKTSSDFSQSC